MTSWGGSEKRREIAWEQWGPLIYPFDNISVGKFVSGLNFLNTRRLAMVTSALYQSEILQ